MTSLMLPLASLPHIPPQLVPFQVTIKMMLYHSHSMKQCLAKFHNQCQKKRSALLLRTTAYY